jgi:hypothetical protein
MLTLGLESAKRDVYPGMDLVAPEIDYVGLARRWRPRRARTSPPSSPMSCAPASSIPGPALVDVVIDRGQGHGVIRTGGEWVVDAPGARAEHAGIPACTPADDALIGQSAITTCRRHESGPRSWPTVRAARAAGVAVVTTAPAPPTRSRPWSRPTRARCRWR